MQLTLTASDLAAMPAALRQALLDYVAARREGRPATQPRRLRPRSAGVSTKDLVTLNPREAGVLVRSVSFGRKARALHELLEALAYDKDADAPAPDALLARLNLDDRGELQRLFTAIKRLMGRASAQRAPLARYSRARRAYIVHPSTRANLREVFAGLALRLAASEEPPWA